MVMHLSDPVQATPVIGTVNSSVAASEDISGLVNGPEGAQPSTDAMFDAAAEIFRVMSAPMRLKIINALCAGEKNVGQLLEEINTTQPNMSQHLQTLYQHNILGKRRDGVQIFYRIVDEKVVAMCRAVCVQVATDKGLAHS
jgi:DNA-binding transcriptional ArsR family regulator